MSVLNGFKKYKNYKADANGDHQLQSFWTSSDTVEVDTSTNKTLTTKLGEIDAELASLPNPMVFKGTLGAQADNPTITALPVDGSATIGDTYKVITDGTYASVTAKVGDMFTCLTKTSSANTWTHIPSGDDSIVIANPSGTATDELEKISIDNTIYNIKDTKAREDITEVDTASTTPFLYRQTPHNADGVFLDELVGGSVAWNQLVQNGDFSDGTNSWQLARCTGTVSNNVLTVTPTTTDPYIRQDFTNSLIVGHKYFYACTVNKSIRMLSAASNSSIVLSEGNNNFILDAASNGFLSFIDFRPVTTSDTSSWTISNIRIIDLTQMFGTTIADYVYTLEQATAGSGIAWLKSYGFFTKDYYPYNTGELISVKTSGKKYVGFNQWDEEWENGYYRVTDGSPIRDANYVRSKNANPINIEPQTEYCAVVNGNYPFVNDIFTLLFYDENGTYLSYTDLRITGGLQQIFTTPQNARKMRFYLTDYYGSTYNHDICINISKTEGTPKNGDYVPYEEHTYDISNIDLRGIPKLVNNELVYDGDTYDSNGDVTRKYGIVDLGSLSWHFDSSSARMYSDVISAIKPVSSNTNTAKVMCYKYIATSVYNQHTRENKTVGISTESRIYVYDTTYTDATTFKTAMNGVYLIYELATPTTETADPYTNPQICDKDGTEEFIDDRTVPIPVGHNSRYADLPAIMDGDYLSYMVRNFASEEYVDKGLDTKVDKVSGKGLSTNDYTDAEKALVATIPDKADNADVEGTKTVSGNPITLTDAAPINAESLVVEFEPKQDLHGQSAPYVGGAGKNKLPMTVDGIKAANTAGTWSGNVYTLNNVAFTLLTDSGNNITGIKVNGTASTSAIFNLGTVPSQGANVIVTGCPEGGSLTTYKVRVQISGTDYREYGSGITYTSNADSTVDIVISQGFNAQNQMYYPMVRLSTETDPTFAPYSNICPITGYTECEVDDVGKNLWNPSPTLKFGIDNVVGTDGVFVSGDYEAQVLEIKGDGNFILNNYSNVNVRDNALRIFYSNEYPDVGVAEYRASNTSANRIIANTAYKYVTILYKWKDDVAQDYKDHVQLEYGQTATTFEPYVTSSATIQFGQTVYGGSVNFLTGELMVDTVKLALGTLSWTPYSSANRIYYSDVISDIADDKTSVCDSYKAVQSSPADLGDGEYRIFTNNRFYIRDMNYSGAGAFKTHLTNDNVYATYKLAEPIEIQLTPQELKLLKQYNNITTNGTTINLGYQPDNSIGDAVKASEEYVDRLFSRLGIAETTSF